MKKEFFVEGMTCAACVSAVEKSVGKLEGANKVEVNLLKKNMYVDFDDTKINSKDVIEAVEKAGYQAEEKTEAKAETKTVKKDIYEKELKNKSFRLKVSFLFMIPLMYVAMGEMYGLYLPEFLKGHEHSLTNIFLQFLLTLPVIFVNSSYFTHGFKSLFNGTPNMDSLIATGSGASMIYGIYTTFQLIDAFQKNSMELIMQHAHDVYFESAAMILTLITLGKYFETKSKRRTSNAISKLLDFAPKKANVIRNGEVVEINSEDIVLGDIVSVKPGERIPADGIVTEGITTVDQSVLTGESIPVEKEINSEVYAATMNKNGSIKFKVTKAQTESAIAKIIELVDEASSSKAPISKLADKIAGIFVPVVLGIAAITFAIWKIKGMDFEFSIMMAISVLVISCPCALGLATPVAIMVSTGKGASLGVLIKSAESLEILHLVDSVVLDKTGTITVGRPFVTDIETFDTDRDEFLNAVYALEKNSEHPLADAIINYAENKITKEEKLTNFKAVPGKGVEGELNGKKYFAGNSKILESLNLYGDSVKAEAERFAEEGKTPMYFATEEKVLGIIAAADIIKKDAVQSIRELKNLGLKVIMLTGDNKITADAIAKKTGVDEVIADVLPEDKEKVVRKLQKDNKKVAMVGDGINDAPALARADVGLAIGAGTDIAIESADVVLMKNSLMDVVNAINLSKKTIQNIKQNLFWAFFYNSLGIPIAAGLFYESFGLRLSPMLGALAMSFSSVFVVTNALRLNNFKAIKAEIKNSQSNDTEVNILNKSIKNEKGEREMTEKKMIIEGMSCGHCKKRVENALNEIEGVNAEVILEDKMAKVEMSKEVSDDVLKNAVEEAGYEVVEIQ